jgi:hypothetical protein
VSNQTNKVSNSVIVGLAFCAGIGLILMLIALSIGVIDGDQANANSLGVLFAAGLLMLIGGIGGWLGAVRPFDHFDNINLPAEEEHHDEHAIVEHQTH